MLELFALPAGHPRTSLSRIASTVPRVSCDRACSSLDGLDEAYRRHGGLCDPDSLAGSVREWVDQPVSVIARLILSRRIVTLEHGSSVLVPLFQFEGASLVVRTEVSMVIAELADILDDCELASWFVTCNAWLGGARPIALIHLRPHAVHEAARADRFIAHGG